MGENIRFFIVKNSNVVGGYVSSRGGEKYPPTHHQAPTIRMRTKDPRQLKKEDAQKKNGSKEEEGK